MSCPPRAAAIANDAEAEAARRQLRQRRRQRLWRRRLLPRSRLLQLRTSASACGGAGVCELARLRDFWLVATMATMATLAASGADLLVPLVFQKQKKSLSCINGWLSPPHTLLPFYYF